MDFKDDAETIWREIAKAITRFGVKACEGPVIFALDQGLRMAYGAGWCARKAEETEREETDP